jgi:NodT family efflux transporter outer membrane factor (OMF) lipoprotein
LQGGTREGPGPDAKSRRGPFAVARVLAALAISSSLGGCALSPDKTGAGVAIPAAFENAAPAPTRAPGLARWWTQFGSAELTQLVERASASSLDVAAAAARLQQADAQARIAGAALLPTLGVNANLSRSQSSGTTGVGVRSPSRQSLFSGVLSAGFEVDIWGRNRDLLTAAELTKDSAFYAREVVRLSTQGAVVASWLDLAAARDRLAIAERNVGNARRVLGVLRDRLAAGTGTALDIAQQESLLANLQAAIPPLRLTAETSRTALALLIGTPPQGFKAVAPSLSRLRTPRVAAGLPSSLLLRRPDLRNAESALAAADADVSAARKALLPTLSLTADGGYASSALARLFRPESLLWSLAAGVAQPIFEGGLLRARISLSEAQRLELLELYRRAIVSGFVDVENALARIREAAAQEATRRVALDKARTAFQLAEQRLREGTIDLQTLLNTQATLFQVEDSLALDRRARLQAAASLFQALGGDVLGAEVIAAR